MQRNCSPTWFCSTSGCQDSTESTQLNKYSRFLRPRGYCSYQELTIQMSCRSRSEVGHRDTFVNTTPGLNCYPRSWQLWTVRRQWVTKSCPPAYSNPSSNGIGVL